MSTPPGYLKDQLLPSLKDKVPSAPNFSLSLSPGSLLVPPLSPLLPLAQSFYAKLGSFLRTQLSSCPHLAQWASCHGLPLSPPETVLDTSASPSEHARAGKHPCRFAVSSRCQQESTLSIRVLFPSSPGVIVQPSLLSLDFLRPPSIGASIQCYVQFLLCSPRVDTCPLDLPLILLQAEVAGPWAEDPRNRNTQSYGEIHDLYKGL